MVRAFSAGGQLDLNAAPAESIEKLLLAVGTDKDRAAGLARAIAEFREGGDTLSSGTESKSALYREAGLRHGPKNAAFASVNELEQVLGMDKALFARLRPLVTVHSHRATIDPELAQAILISSGIPIASVSGPASAVRSGCVSAALLEALLCGKRFSCLPAARRLDSPYDSGCGSTRIRTFRHRRNNQASVVSNFSPVEPVFGGHQVLMARSNDVELRFASAVPANLHPMTLS